MCSVIVYFLHCICVCDCDSCHESLIMLSHSVMVRRSYLLARCYLGTMCMCTTTLLVDSKLFPWDKLHSRNDLVRRFCRLLCSCVNWFEHQLYHNNKSQHLIDILCNICL
jgi:hypothetical protein